MKAPLRRKHRSSTVYKIKEAVGLLRRGYKLKEIGERLGATKEGVRQWLVNAIRNNFLTENEYNSLKNNGYVKKCERERAYFFDVLDNITRINRECWKRISDYYGLGCQRSRNAERKGLEELANKMIEEGKDSRVCSAINAIVGCGVDIERLEKLVREKKEGRMPVEVMMIDYVIQHFKQRKISLEKVYEIAREYVETSVTLSEIARKHLLTNNKTNPASDAMKQVRYAVHLGIIGEEEYREKGLKSRQEAWKQNEMRQRKYPVEVLERIMNMYEKTGMPYARLARIVGVPVHSVYSYRKKIQSRHCLEGK
ncbi:MAG: hypothetical protein QXR48_04500 [Candidatus Woesearchaeota archaeon]